VNGLLLKLYPVVITSFVMEKPRRVTEALADMQMQLETHGISTIYSMCVQSPIASADASGSTSVEKLRLQWLRHFSYLVDGKALFNSALKTYDLGTALMVAQNSDRDPKEYLPILNELKQKKPALYQRYHIDLLLGDWESALSQLADLLDSSDAKEPMKTEEWLGESPASILEQCQQLIGHHKLHSKALLYFPIGRHASHISKVDFNYNLNQPGEGRC
jgi:hypothetical protein